MKFSIIFTLLLLFLLPSCKTKAVSEQSPSGRQDAMPLLSMHKPTMISVYPLILGSQLLGTCFPVASKKNNIVLLTAFHNISKLRAEEIKQLHIGHGQGQRVLKIYTDAGTSDIAMLIPESAEQFEPYPLGEQPHENEYIYTYFYAATDYKPIFSRFLALGYTLFPDDQRSGRIFCHLNLAYPGSSGAPVLNAQDHAIGVILMRVTAANDNHYAGVTNALSTELLKNFINSIDY